VLVVYDPSSTDAEHLLKAFWENHDPTTADRQGNDVGTQYRSAIFYTTDEQRRAAVATREAFARLLRDAQRGEPTTEIRPVDGGRERAAGTDSPGVGGVPAAAPGAGQAPAAGPFYYAEEYHQQYLHKNPNGYCNHGPNGMTCPVGLVGPRTMRHEAT
jgi:peptide-methionine (S)-S-oxide reductase